MLKEMEWNTINSILLDLYTIDSLDVLTNKLMKMSRMLIPYTKGFFVMVDENENILADKNCFVGMDDEEIQKYMNYYYHQDYLKYLYEISTMTNVYKDTNIIEDEIREHTAFYQDFLKPANIPYGCGILIMKDEKIIGIFNLFRSDSLGDFTDKDIYILNTFKKHIENIVYKAIQNDNSDFMSEKCYVDMVAKYNLTAREEEVLRLLCQGLSSDEIVKELVVTISTVKKHIYNLYNKTEVKSRTQLINLLYKKCS